ncbi:hypothetical protein Terro_0904 [Terriglobus roseus DSM 18391]|uniref:Uncharacterized protein n=1 Tax=Terriglobus roseus (strain DSM 18391 / NRRL B-41598 / KBS 63) TaxID=926566 RepID=I3ZDB2_TERRK|nr:hypothetical protein [Terriglobus roseus]AFL87230.1 hypothetical protein Terro_0904 [Terriglobus roseus DSM 18391]
MRLSTALCVLALALPGAARCAFAESPQYVYCFSYEHERKAAILVSQIVRFGAPETRTDFFERLVRSQSALEVSESGCSVSMSLEDATADRASFIASGGNAHAEALRQLPVREVIIDADGLELRDRLQLADTEAAVKGEPMYIACFVNAGPGKFPVLLAAPFLSRQEGSAVVKDAMRSVPAWESYITPQCEAHADKERAAAFLKQGVALAASYRVPTAELKINGQ